MKILKSVLALFIIVLLNSCNQKSNTDFYLPAEWETQSGVIVNGFDDAATIEMVTQLSKETKVYCIAVDTLVEVYKKKCSDAGATLDSIQFLITSYNVSSFAERDGLLFMKNEKGEKQMVNFAWNAYGWYFENEFKKQIEKEEKNREAYTVAHTAAFPYTMVSSAMVNEGGAIETNGKGTILQVESVNMQRNPGMTKEQQEMELKKVLNAKKIIWLKEGAAEDPFGWGTLIAENYFGMGVRGHIDEFCRFVNDSTILISYPDAAEAGNDPVKKINLQRMKVNYEILKNATDQDGRPFTIIKMPVPDNNYMTFALDTTSIIHEIKFLSRRILREQKSFSIGDTVHFVPSSSYLNFLITNKTVYEAKYWTEGQTMASKAKDEKAKQILQQYFPGKNIYQINTTETNHNGGGLHCWSMQVPK